MATQGYPPCHHSGWTTMAAVVAGSSSGDPRSSITVTTASLPIGAGTTRIISTNPLPNPWAAAAAMTETESTAASSVPVAGEMREAEEDQDLSPNEHGARKESSLREERAADGRHNLSCSCSRSLNLNRNHSCRCNRSRSRRCKCYHNHNLSCSRSRSRYHNRSHCRSHSYSRSCNIIIR